MSKTARGKTRKKPASSPPDGLIIRSWRPSDAEGVTRLSNMPKYRFGTLRIPYESPDVWRRRIETADPQSWCLVAELEGDIVGVVGLDPRKGRRVHVAEIGMGVHDDHHGRGIGRALLSAVIEIADRWLNLRRLELNVFADNEPAIALYRSFGFTIEGTHRDYAFRDGAFADVVSMARLNRLK